MGRAWVLSLVLLGAGCRFDRAGLPRQTPDAPALDSTLDRPPIVLLDGPASDRAAGEKLPLDRQPPDRRAPDDKLAPDKLAPDAVPDCLGKYGSAGIPGFKLCDRVDGHCVFYFADPSTASCGTMCAKGGGTCSKSMNDSTDGCETYSDGDCTAVYGDAVCVCVP
jgi:hypothetical protein